MAIITQKDIDKIVNILNNINSSLCNIDLTSSQTFGTTEEVPVDAPVEGGPTVLIDLSSGTIYYWDGDSWETTLSSGFTLTLTDTEPSTEEDAVLILDAEHNTTGDGVFLRRYPGDIAVPANNTVVPWVIHALKGEDPTGFNEENQADYVYFYGINARRFVGDPYYNPLRGGVGQSMELYYDAMDDTLGRQEYHLVHSRPSGLGETRFFTWQGFEDPAKGSTAAFQIGDDAIYGVVFSLRLEDGTDRVTFDWGNKIATLYNEIALVFQENDYGVLRQSNAAGNSSIEIVRVDANDDVAIAGETYVFKVDAPVLHTNAQGFAIGDEDFPILAGLLTTSSNGNLLRLKQDNVSNEVIISRDLDEFFLGWDDQSQIMRISRTASANSFVINTDGSVSLGGQAPGAAKMVVGGTINDKAYSAQSLGANAQAFYVATTGSPATVYSMYTDVTATSKLVNFLQNYSGHVELQLYAHGAGKTTTVRYGGGTNTYSTGVNKTNDSFHIYLDGDVLAGGTSVMEFTAAGRIKPNIPTYADDAAANVGGLTSGMLYKTATGEVRIKT